MTGLQEEFKADPGTILLIFETFPPDGLPTHGFTTLLADLATLTLNEVSLPGSPDHAFPLMAMPPEPQGRAFELQRIDLAQDFAMQVTGWIRGNRPLAL